MKAALALLAAAPLTLASQAPEASAPEPLALDMPAYQAPARRWVDIDDVKPDQAACREKIERVRAETGQPPLQRDAEPAEPLLIAAVDHRIDGCAAIMMRNDTSDIRPVPPDSEQAARLIPAR